MRSQHLHDFHFPKGPNIKLIANSAVLMFSACLVMFFVFSAFGGSNFSDSMGGATGCAFLIIGLLVSLTIAFLERDRDSKD